jgi:tetratricopeptide (TPR) repeat protein
LKCLNPLRRHKTPYNKGMKQTGFLLTGLVLAVALLPAAAHAEVALRPYPTYGNAVPPIQFTVRSTGKMITLPSQPKSAAQVTLPRGAGLTPAQKSQLRQALLLYQAHKLPECEKALVSLASQASQVGAMQALLGEFYISTMQFAKAQQAYQKAMVLTPRPGYLDTISLLVFTQAQNNKDWPRLERHCQQHPYSAYAQYLLGIARQMSNQPVNSLAAFEQAVRLQPGFVDAHYNLACLQETLGHLKPARDHYLATLKLQPDAKDALTGLKRVETQQQKVAAETAAKVAKTLERTTEEVEQYKRGNPFTTELVVPPKPVVASPIIENKVNIVDPPQTVQPQSLPVTNFGLNPSVKAYPPLTGSVKRHPPRPDLVVPKQDDVLH